MNKKKLRTIQTHANHKQHQSNKLYCQSLDHQTIAIVFNHFCVCMQVGTCYFLRCKKNRREKFSFFELIVLQLCVNIKIQTKLPVFIKNLFFFLFNRSLISQKFKKPTKVCLSNIVQFVDSVFFYFKKEHFNIGQIAV